MRTLMNISGDTLTKDRKVCSQVFHCLFNEGSRLRKIKKKKEKKIWVK